jgi:hypothetical protein
MPCAGRLSIVALGMLVMGASSAFAQARPPATPRRWTGIVSANGGVQAGTHPLEQTSEVDTYVEPAVLSAERPTTAVPFLDGGVTVRLWRNLGVGAAVSFLSTTGDAEISAGIPHPFYFDRPRAVAGEASAGHRETAVHADAAWLFELSTIDVLVFGGASFFQVRQDLVADVLFDEEYPYDVAAFVGADVERVDESATGFNLGADVTWKLSGRWGVGGLVRYSRAELPLSVDGVDAGSLTVGGVMIGGGLRVTF